MNTNKKFLIIGEVFVDQHLDIAEEGASVSRLGGIFHAARCCNALDIDYALAFYAPSYLFQYVEKFGIEILHASSLYNWGIIEGAPNVMLIRESDESGNQYYDNILCKQATIKDNTKIERTINDYNPTDVIVFPGRYNNVEVLNELKKYSVDVHVDLNYDSEKIIELEQLNIKTAFISTSSFNLKKWLNEKTYNLIIEKFRDKYVERLIIKENRGGSWLYDYGKERSFEAPAYLTHAVHSVGVGDVFDVVFLSEKCGKDSQCNMTLASWMASAYATTLDYERFKSIASDILDDVEELITLEGIRVPWGKRQDYPIYIAGPDFDNVNTEKIDELEKALLYHNFVPHRPIVENGQVNSNMSLDDKYNIFACDMELLEKCKLMVAVLLYNDQGTLVEIGNYQAKGKTVILYDPYNILNNMFLENACSNYCNTKSQVIDAVFYSISRMVDDEK